MLPFVHSVNFSRNFLAFRGLFTKVLLLLYDNARAINRACYEPKKWQQREKIRYRPIFSKNRAPQQRLRKNRDDNTAIFREICKIFIHWRFIILPLITCQSFWNTFFKAYFKVKLSNLEANVRVYFTCQIQKPSHNRSPVHCESYEQNMNWIPTLSSSNNQQRNRKPTLPRQMAKMHGLAWS